MVDDEEKKKLVVEEPAKENKEPGEPLSIVEEAKAIREEILEAKESLKKENDRKEKLQANELLSSSAGGRVETKPKEETDKEYSDRIDQDIREGKYNG